tara:strand:+ start:1074 stop:1964 length:891 start_codon:yes stop_codon:yes gene_type:complete
MEVSYDSNSQLPSTNDYYLNKTLNNPNLALVFLLLGIIVIYIILFSFLGAMGNSNNSGGSSSLRIFELVIFIIFVGAVVLNLKYFSGNDLSIDSIIKNLFNEEQPEVDIYVNDKPDNSVCQNNNDNNDNNDNVDNGNNEVFHVPNNVYNFEQAKAICKAYDSELATYNQIEDAYNKGANWCSYGWSEGQLALFPTQKSTFDELQDNKGHENDCGRPGINGGYIDNKLVRFGVNCFGPKPILNENDKIYMDNLKYQPLTKENVYVKNKSEMYKQQLNNIVVAPFNNDTWSLSQPINE